MIKAPATNDQRIAEMDRLMDSFNARLIAFDNLNKQLEEQIGRLISRPETEKTINNEKAPSASENFSERMHEMLEIMSAHLDYLDRNLMHLKEFTS